MTMMLSAHDLARLHLDLEVPTLLCAIMERHDLLSLEDEEILRRALTPMDSAETLISVACCFQVFAPYLRDEQNVFAPLLMHADYILDDYAPYLMKETFPQTSEWADFIQEDLEALSEFLCILSDATHGLHPALPEICDLLNEQAYAKSLHIILPQPVCTGGNVIRFPVERRL